MGLSLRMFLLRRVNSITGLKIPSSNEGGGKVSPELAVAGRREGGVSSRSVLVEELSSHCGDRSNILDGVQCGTEIFSSITPFSGWLPYPKRPERARCLRRADCGETLDFDLS